jgi:hypothetical protein
MEMIGPDANDRAISLVQLEQLLVKSQIVDIICLVRVGQGGEEGSGVSAQAVEISHVDHITEEGYEGCRARDGE